MLHKNLGRVLAGLAATAFIIGASSVPAQAQGVPDRSSAPIVNGCCGGGGGGSW